MFLANIGEVLSDPTIKNIVLPFVGVIVVIILFVLITNKSKSKEETMPKDKLVLGDEYISHTSSTPSVTVNKTEENNVISVIYMHVERGEMWVCPNCECENDKYSDTCCVCNKSR